MHYDLIIVGGGLVGRSLAAALGPLPLRIALVDASPQERPDARLIALNYGSSAFLNKIGVWPSLEAFSAAIQEVHVSQRGHFGTTRMKAKDLKLPALGYVVPAEHINQALAKLLSARAQQAYQELRPATLKSLTLQENAAELLLETPQGETRISGELIIGADGTESTLRRLLNFATERMDYQQSALVTTTTLSRSSEGLAYERFLDEGALALLPLQGSTWKAATIWTASNTQIKHLMQLTEEDFLAELQQAFGYRLGRLQSISARQVYPLHFVRVQQPVHKNVLLLGNAAHTLHPVGAQGLNLALYEIAHLAQRLESALEKQEPLKQVLAEPLLGKEQKTNLLLSHYLNPLFASRQKGLQFARQLGLLGLDLCTPLKRQFSRVLAMEGLKWL